MNSNRDIARPINAFSGLLDNSAAAQAAARLYRSHDGIRFCADNRECLTADEARALDAREASRRGLPSHHPSQPEEFSLVSELSDGSGTDDFADPDFDDLEVEASTDDHLIDFDDDNIDIDDDDDVMALEDAGVFGELVDAG